MMEIINELNTSKKIKIIQIYGTRKDKDNENK